MTRNRICPGTKSLVLLGAALLTLAAPTSAQEEVFAGPEGRDLMQELSTSFKGLIAGLEASDQKATLLHARALNTASKRLKGVKPRLGETDREIFRGEAAHIEAVTAEMIRLANVGRLRRASDGIMAIRTSCVGCHVRFRPHVEDIGRFPARCSTVTGTVSLKDSEGKARSDRSDVLVFLEHSSGSARFPVPLLTPSISQKDRQFNPRVLPILKGTTVDFPNDDNVFHNVFSLAKEKECCFDLDIYEPGKTRSVTLEKSGLVKVLCNIHPSMVSSIIVLNNPYFALTDSDGNFVIPEVPAGDYTLRVWNEFGAGMKQQISLGKTDIHRVDLSVREKRKTLPQHKNKFGKSYRKKY